MANYVVVPLYSSSLCLCPRGACRFICLIKCKTSRCTLIRNESDCISFIGSHRTKNVFTTIVYRESTPSKRFSDFHHSGLHEGRHSWYTVSYHPVFPQFLYNGLCCLVHSDSTKTTLGSWTRCNNRISVLCISRNTHRVAHRKSSPG